MQRQIIRFLFLVLLIMLTFLGAVDVIKLFFKVTITPAHGYRLLGTESPSSTSTSLNNFVRESDPVCQKNEM